MKGLSILGMVFMVFSSFSGCEGDEPGNCTFGCPNVYVLGQFNYINDTMYVGDTIILTLQIPDSVEETDLEGLQIQVPVNTFKNQWSISSIFKIDTTESNQLSKDSTKLDFMILKGGHYRNHTFTESYPFVHQVRYILKKPGLYFLTSGAGNECKINGVRRSLIIDYDVAEKHFEWLKPLASTFQDGSVEKIAQYDADDVINYFPFQVLEK